MMMEERETSTKKILRGLCSSNGCSYGVLWRFDHRNHLLLTMEDAYFEEHARSIVDSMHLQVHMLGEGKIGESAVDGKHRWISVDSLTQNQNAAWVDVDFGRQFSYGIKTIVVIPLMMHGVVQFGFTKEILETPEFLDQVRKSLLERDNSLAGFPSSSLNPEASLISSDDMGCYWMVDSLPFPGVHFDGINGDNYNGGDLVIDSNFDSLVKDNGEASLHYGSKLSNPQDVFEGQFNSSSLLDGYQINDFPQFLSGPPKVSFNGSDPFVIDEMLHTLGADCLSSGIQEGKQSANLGLPTVDDSLVTQFGIGTDLISLIEDKCNNLPIDTSISISECISGGVEGSSVGGKPKGLFSELGLDQFLQDGATTSSASKSCVYYDQWTISKKRQTETLEASKKEAQLDKECLQKAQIEPWINEKNAMDAKSCISGVSQPTKRPEEPPKPTKKRARPGESTRPRPKDRQMIADRIKELREMIPNGSKLSIDALLGRTVKHMLFLQNLTKHVDTLKELGESKLIGQKNSLVQKDNENSICSSSSNINSRGATWAYEVGGQNLCPIIVEDLNHPGQMLIEMLCEERGYFLEIADIVRGLGLTILKGVMEARDDKIWAHYIVEGNRNVTRMDVFVSLMQLLQVSSATIEVNRGNEPVGPVHNNGPSWNNSYNNHQHLVPVALPI